MSIHHILHNNVLDNPIQRRESITLDRQRGKWFWWFMYLVTGFFFMIPILWGFGENFPNAINVTLSLLVFHNFIVFIMVVIRAVTHGSDSMFRERRGKTWDLLMLTGISNWRVVIGKWVGVMRHLMRDYAWLYIVRIGTFVWASVLFNLQQDFTYRELNPSYYSEITSYVSVLDARISLDFIVVAIAFIFFLTVLELMLSSAIGLAVAFFKFTAKTSSALGVIVRVGLAVLIPITTYLFFAYGDGDRYVFNVNERQYNDDVLIYALRASTFLADNGVFSTLYYIDDYDSFDSGNRMIFAFQLANTTGIGLYLLFTLLALMIAANRAKVRGLDLMNGVMPKVKPKRATSEQPITSIQENTPATQIVAVPANQSNVFNFANEDQLSIDLYHYQRRLGRMVLRVSDDKLSRYIQLSNVAYVEAPAFWKGANFRTGSVSEFEAFVKEKGIYVNGLTADAMRLYILEGNSSVKIVAGTAQILDELSDSI